MKTKKLNKISFTVIESGIDESQLSALDMMNTKGGIAGGYCGANGCGGDACSTAGCGGAACGANGCIVNACGANACSLQLCPIDVCPADACWTDFFITPSKNICQRLQ